MRDALDADALRSHVMLDGHPIPYRLEVRSRRRTVGMSVDPDGTVAVFLPPGFPPSAVPVLLERHQRRVHRQRARLPVLPQFKEGGQIRYLGQFLTLCLDADGHPEPRIVADGHLLHGPTVSETRLREYVAQWLESEARAILPERLQAIGQTLGVNPRTTRIGRFRTRWGYCRRDGLIALNWRLIQAPQAVVDYVAVHELMHITHPHHQPVFWRAVKQVLPDADDSRRWLKEEGQALFW